MFNLSPVTSADINLEQLCGARVKMVYARPSFQSPIIETCTVLDYAHSKRGEFQLLVQPDNARLPAKWRSEGDFVAYVRNSQIAEVSTNNVA